MVYQWKHHEHKVSAATVGKILESMPQITPEAVVAAARPETSPLHSLFCWDDTIAAEEWRKQQARVLIANIEIVEPEQPTVRAFLNIRTVTGESEYFATKQAMANKETREQVLAAAVKELQAFRRKYSGLSQLAGIFAAIDEQVQSTKIVAYEPQTAKDKNRPIDLRPTKQQASG